AWLSNQRKGVMCFTCAPFEWISYERSDLAEAKNSSAQRELLAREPGVLGQAAEGGLEQRRRDLGVVRDELLEARAVEGETAELRLCPDSSSAGCVRAHQSHLAEEVARAELAFLSLGLDDGGAVRDEEHAGALGARLD